VTPKVAIISVTFVVIVAIAAVVGIHLAKRQERIWARERGFPLKGDLTWEEEQELLYLLADAEKIFRGLGQRVGYGLDDIEIIRTDTKIDVGRWLKRYNHRKETISK
jgi:hypothetical protein